MSTFPVKQVTTYKGWDICHAPVGGYYLISEVGDSDYVQKPFRSVAEARDFIDRMHGSTSDNRSYTSMTFNEHYVKVITSKSFWLNPFVVIFTLIVLIGTVVGAETGGNLFVDMLKSVAGLSMIFVMVALIPATVGWYKDNFSQKDKEEDARK